MILSKFAHFIEIQNNVYALYNSLFMKILFVDGHEKEKIEKFNVTLKEKDVLLENGIYVKDEKNDDKVFGIKWLRESIITFLLIELRFP